MTTAVFAQPANPAANEAKQAYTSIKTNLTKLAEKMPEENYAFKPVDTIRTFGQLIAHLADSQTRTCNAVKGTPKQGDAASKTAKADLVAALKASFADCDAAFDAMTEANASEMINMGRGQRSRLGSLVGILTHGNEEYGYLAVYLRLKGIVPPSSEPRQ
jgi:hypothetical protein